MVGKASHTCKHTRVAAVIVVWRVRTTGRKLTRMMDVGGGGGGDMDKDTDRYVL